MSGPQALAPRQQSKAGDLFKAGRLQAALQAQTAEVKSQPQDQAQRFFLFELLAFNGNFDRARRQIDAVQFNELELDATVANYRRLLDAEQARRDLFERGLRPQLLGPSPEHLELRLSGLECLREDHPAEAARLLKQAAENTAPLRGELNGRPFTILLDADELFGTIVEVMSGTGAYFWLPLEQITSLTVEAPQSPRDLLWAPAHLELASGAEGDVFLPALYPYSWEHADENVRLGRATDWVQNDDSPVLGRGLRTYLVDDDALTLLQWQELQISHE